MRATALPARNPTKSLAWPSSTMRWAAAGRIWKTVPMTNDATSDQGLNDFLGERPERPWRKWAVRGAVGVALLILVLLLALCFSGDEQPNYAAGEVRTDDQNGRAKS